VVSIKPDTVSVNELETRLRTGSPPIIARIREDLLMLDARTVREIDLEDLVKRIKTALSENI
jgi:seryl-tRNA(Sec) selenium transferase